MAKLPTFEERTKVVQHKCHVYGCDGTVTKTVLPSLWSLEDRQEMHRNDPEWQPRPVPKDVPAEAKYFDAMMGITIHDCCNEAVEYANLLQQQVAFHFNDRLVVAKPGDVAQALVKAWLNSCFGEDQRPAVERLLDR